MELPYVFKADQVMISRYLAEAYHRLDNPKKSRHYANQCISLIEQYVTGKEERKIVKEVRRYR